MDRERDDMRRALYPPLRSVQESARVPQDEAPYQQPPDTSRDEELARSLQKQLDCEQPQQPLRMAVAQPVAPAELPYKCGACGTTHAVRNVSHGATFACANCGAPNQILLADAQRIVVVGRPSFGIVPIPLFCAVM